MAVAEVAVDGVRETLMQALKLKLISTVYDEKCSREILSYGVGKQMMKVAFFWADISKGGHQKKWITFLDEVCCFFRLCIVL